MYTKCYGSGCRSCSISTVCELVRNLENAVRYFRGFALGFFFESSCLNKNGSFHPIHHEGFPVRLIKHFNSSPHGQNDAVSQTIFSKAFS